MKQSAKVMELDQRITSVRKSSTRIDMKKISSNEDLNIPSIKNHWAVMLLHWITVMAILVGVGSMFIREYYVEEYSYRTWLLELHRQMGVVVLLGLVIRLPLRFLIGKSAHKPLPFFLRLCGGFSHFLLYSLLVVLPLLGLAVTNAHNVKVSFLGLGKLPSLAAADSDLANTLTDYHLLGSWVLLGVLVLHICSALVHHYVFKDEVLSAMLPGKAKASTRLDKIVPYSFSDKRETKGGKVANLGR